MGRYLFIYLCLLLIAALQFVVAYSNLDAKHMLVRMLLLAAVEALLAVLFFMHLLAEKRGFTLFVAVITIVVLISMQFGWSDSFRLLNCGGRCS